MKDIYISGKSIFTNRSLKIGIREGYISSVIEIDDCYNYISPGFMDIQVNGYNRKDYSSDLDNHQIEQLIYDLGKSGTTRHFPTIITNSESQILKSIRSIVKARKSSTLVEYAIGGIHIEGPFISPEEGARGVHNPRNIREADYMEFKRWQEAAEGLIKIVTLSPENDNSLSFIRKVSENGVIAAIGHTNVSPEMIDKAVDAGASLSTHIGNGCPSFIPRLENFIWKQLANENLTSSIIADGFHIPVDTLKCFTRCKGKDKTILISDAAALGGSVPGLYKWGDMDIRVFEDGHMRLNNTKNLAGASLLLDKCIGNLCRSTDLTIKESVICATLNPCQLTQTECWNSDPVIGDKADIISFIVNEGFLNINKVIGFDKILYDIEETGN